MKDIAKVIGKDFWPKRESRISPQSPLEIDVIFSEGSCKGRILDLSLHGASIILPVSLRSGTPVTGELQINGINISLPSHIVRISRYDNSQQVVAVKWNPSPKDIEVLLTDIQSNEILYDSDSSEEATAHFATTIIDATEEIKKYLAKHPEKVYDLSPRRFEELVASILKDMGLDVNLTKSTRDGGVDIYAYIRHQVASFVILVECKKWSPNHHVGIEIVQRLYGIHQAKNANKSLIVTTSFFTEPAKQECRLYQGLMELKDFDLLKQWLQKYL